MPLTNHYDHWFGKLATGGCGKFDLTCKIRISTGTWGSVYDVTQKRRTRLGEFWALAVAYYRSGVL